MILGLLMGFFGAALMVAAVETTDTPTCDDVRAGEAEPKDGECSDNSATVKSIADVLGFGIAGAFIASAIAMLIFGITGRRPWLRRSGILVAATVGLFALTYVVTHI